MPRAGVRTAELREQEADYAAKVGAVHLVVIKVVDLRAESGREPWGTIRGPKWPARRAQLRGVRPLEQHGAMERGVPDGPS